MKGKIQRALVLASLLVSVLAFAEPDRVYVDLLDPSVQPEQVQGPHLTVRAAPTGGLPSELPSVKMRDQFIEQAGLKKETSKMDQLDRDLLFKKAEWDTLEELQKKYPAIPSEKLKKFQALVKGTSS